ncbi:helix-turn-helix transcriptional regulator [Leucobacter sp. PH1c]|uniref:helix-turn-helix transcriptional regulator n=1 Tax=Leucobacter sp. PH1c TaxID=1397278 RepID=UPI000469B64A|nr:helix-turn-helix transcriptional regulator [Leucobacter sp. PH1c]
METNSGYRQLADAVREFEAACAQDTIDEALCYFDLYALEVWFGSTPSRLRGLLGDLIRRGAPRSSVVGGVYAFLLGDPVETPLTAARQNQEVLPEAEPFARMFEHRLRGQTREAVRAGEEIVAKRLEPNAVFDRRGGWDLFLSVQLGTTAMLAGDVAQALGHFTEAWMHPPAPVLRCLLREAYAKAALIEACDGDPVIARRCAERAAEISRTTSWLEPGIDAILGLASALLEAEPDAARARLDAIPLGQVGEMWPFGAIATNRILVAQGEEAEAQRRLEMFDGMSLPRTAGVGYPGSMVALLRAGNMLARDNAHEAERLISTADPELPRTQLGEALVSLKVGQPRRALQQLLRMPEMEAGLRRVAVLRHALLAATHLRLEQRTECEAVLVRAMRLPGRFTAEDAEQFVPDVRRIAEGAIPEWPETDPAALSSFARATAGAGRHLTERELEVLALLAGGSSREEIAAAQFISMNTLKTQLRSVYRKLGVSQRSAAVLEAERRGLI